MILFYEMNMGAYAYFDCKEAFDWFMEDYCKWCLKNYEDTPIKGEDYNFYNVKNFTNPSFKNWVNQPSVD